ncbi:MAG: thrombospondin type 3 repeat-containing protein [Deltaproteobacteria bacterium]|nr:thrombospondin type 3 repeat-containing protein [Deltaproteobacteria bacterium]MDQ3298165.1 thrombospondin type 3 repeat-containing protein [Myxococcota bacterium]
MGAVLAMQCMLAIAALLFGGCNVAFKLDETGPILPLPPDADGDTIEDELDNCPFAENVDQADIDEDGFGDACDLCPTATATNHDEDQDLRGDECDLCPTVPDFQYDTDQDGVGDVCGINVGRPVRLVAFDPFATLAAGWTTRGMRWAARSDAIAPLTALLPQDPGLQNHEIDVPAGPWSLAVAVAATAPWGGSDRFGVGLVDGSGVVVARCELVCDGDCHVEIEFRGVIKARYASSESAPRVSFQFQVVPNLNTPGNQIVSCGFAPPSTLGYYTLNIPVEAETGSPVLFGTPTIRLASFIAYAVEP